jgi:hypothetical protein
MSDDEKLVVELKKLGINRNQLPNFLGVFIRGGNSFSVHVRVWQTAIFANFVYQQELNDFDVEEICNWSYQLFKLKRAFPNSEKVAIWDFLSHLTSLCFLFYQGHQMFTVMVDGLKEPSLDGTKQIATHCPDGELPF